MYWTVHICTKTPENVDILKLITFFLIINVQHILFKSDILSITFCYFSYLITSSRGKSF